MVPFAGYDMPVQYPAGVLKEHLHTRSRRRPVRRLAYGPDRAAGELRPRRGCRAGAGTAGAAGHRCGCAGPAALCAVHQRRRRPSRRSDGRQFRRPSVPGRQRRLQGRGRGASARASRRQLHHRTAARPRADRAAGPEGGSRRWRNLAPTSSAMRFMDAGPRRVGGFACFVSRSGYTGEDGFEISVPAERRRGPGDSAAAKIPTCCRSGSVRATACGSRPGLCLYGHDIDTTTTPVEARARMVGPEKPPQRRRARRRISRARTRSSRSSTRARRAAASACRPEGRAPVREGAALFADATSPSRSARSPRADSARASMRRSRWAIVPTALASRRHAALCRSARAAPAAAGRGQPFVPNTYKR